MMCGCRIQLHEKWHHYTKGIVLFIGAIYSIYSLYYAFRCNWYTAGTNNIFQDSKFTWQGNAVLEDINRDTAQRNLPSNVTVVTAYFNIGKFYKGNFNRAPDLYSYWMTVFGRLDNPLIVFTDSRDVYNLFTKLRQNFASDQSQIYLIDRSELWSFSLASEIRSVFNQSNYPVFYPNTVNENYSCVMHAKFELVKKVIKERMYHTRYLCWLDIGLFRDIAWQSGTFPIQIPPSWNEDKIAYTEVTDFDPTLSPQTVIAENRVWVCGAMFLGRPEIMYLFAEDYMKAVRHLLGKRLMSTDQQVIYSMFLPMFNPKPRIAIQTYTTHGKQDWFYLGYLIKDIWDRKQRRLIPLIQFFLSYL